MSNSYELENIDFEILKILSDDGRTSYRKLAELLNKSPATIKKHVEELEQRSIIRNYGVNIDYEKLGLSIIAFIEITIAKGKMLQVENEIAQNPNVFGVYDVTGEYDAIILAQFKSRSDLSNMIKELNSFEDVIRTNTHLILNVVKEGTSFVDIMQYNK
jgi:Lrp/AsnC family transcriptional regulator for asnA, asnC and gidA